MTNVVRLRRVGRQPTREMQAFAGIFPDGGQGPYKTHSWLYAIGFKDGSIKFGMTAMPRIRMQKHITVLGDQMAWTHLFGCMPGRYAKFGELHALDTAARIAKKVYLRERFHDLSKTDALGCGRAGVDFVRAHHDAWSAVGLYAGTDNYRALFTEGSPMGCALPESQLG